MGLLVALFWILPLAAMWIDRHSTAAMAPQIGLLLLVFPVITLVLSSWDGATSGSVWPWPVGAAIGFISTLFVYYNETALIYAAMYATVALAGASAGAFLKRRSSQHQ
ncbi:hypothetical protein FRC0360_00754 [Corynebacterium diphtheriae]|nr:hypothetical protein FRC0360_00754 [Corynebacterium diphtheriae]